VFVGTLLISLLFTVIKRWYYLVALIVSVSGGQIFVWLIKHLVERPRPPLINALAPENSFSFPSGHSFIAFSFYGLLTYFLFRATKSKFLKVFSIVVGISIISAIGFSRIYLGVHWPSDVLASFASGAAWLTALITTLEIMRKLNHREYAFPPYFKQSLTITLAIIIFGFWGSYIGYFFQAHPLKPLVAIVESRVIISEKDIPQTLFLNLPRTSENIIGDPTEPINIIVINSQEKLTQTLETAGWLILDSITPKSLWRLIIASIFNKPYPQVPGIPSFWNTRPNEFAYGKSTAANSIRERHHIYFWATPFMLKDQRRIWFGTAHFDKTIKLESGIILPIYTIDPAVDKERDKIKSELLETGNVVSWQELQIVEPTLGSTQSGAQFFTDGKSCVFFLKN